MLNQLDYYKYIEIIDKVKTAEQIILPKDEYAHVISEINTNMSEMDRTKNLVTKPIGDYYYTIINYGYNDYRIIGKRPIIDDIEIKWEDNT